MTPTASNLARKLDELAQQFDQISADLLEPKFLADHRRVRSASIKRAAIEPIVNEYRAYQAAVRDADELRVLLREGSPDAELVALAREDLRRLDDEAARLLASIQMRLVTAEDRAIGSVIVEIRAGVGGDEAAIWAGDLFDMYGRFAAARGFSIEMLDASPSDQGGFKHVIARIEGEGVWAELAFEGGTHQVKRVPATETQGRIHTSTATVAILPEPEEIEVELNPADVKEMITTSQGPGGQNVNKVATAVHLIHQPTGVEVRMQDTKSQTQNRVKAWQLLRARLFNRQKAERDAQRAETRNSMIGTAGRSEKIRTYRYKDNLVVDHRLESGANHFNLVEVMGGGMAPLIESLIERETAQRLAAL